MRRVLLANDSTLRIVRIPGEHGIFSFLDDLSPFTARRYLQDYAGDHMAMMQLRMALAEDSFGMTASDLDDAEVIDEAANRIAMRNLWIAEELEEPMPELPEPDPASSNSAAPPPELPRSKRLTWIEFKVVDDHSTKPLNSVRLVVKAPDGNQTYQTTNSQGLVRMEDLEPGNCDISCELKNPTMEDVLSFTGMGEAAESEGNGQDGNGQQQKPAILRIADVEQHKVKKGETLDGLAKKAGMTWKDLAKFNWGTDVPKEINAALRRFVGCTKRTADGANCKFDDSDDPGIVLIPKSWKQESLATAQTHVVRVKPVKLEPKPFRFSI